MKTVPEAAKPHAEASRWALADYVELSKPEVTSLILVATGVGYAAASSGGISPLGLFHTVFGTMLVAAGTAALNQWMERDSDALMRRTGRRPLPSGRLVPWRALLFGVTTGVAGSAYLAATTNALAALLAFGTMVAYLALYTPLKRRTPACTTIGALPGAMPPLIGWAGAAGHLDAGAWILFGILFFWQFPHFLAIAWLYREDYARAGITMLPVVEPDGVRTGWQMIATSALLIPISMAPALFGMGGTVYVAGAFVLGTAFLYSSLRVARRRTASEARRLLHASVIYLPMLYALLLLNR